VKRDQQTFLKRILACPSEANGASHGPKLGSCVHSFNRRNGEFSEAKLRMHQTNSSPQGFYQ
jgi:hypothetical protein